MNVIITPSVVQGVVSAPPSKSYTHRAIILAGLAEGKSLIRGPLLCEDTEHTIKGCAEFGIDIKQKKNYLVIEGKGGKLEGKERKRIFVGNSGTTMRLLASIAALGKGKTFLYGVERMHHRPIYDLILALRALGINAHCRYRYPPIQVEGGIIKGGEVKISGKKSSQFISSLLIISPFAKKDTRIIIKDELVSKPYIDITIELMRRFGVRVDHINDKEFFIPSGQVYKAQTYTVEGDFSNSSYFFAGGAICSSSVAVKNLNANSAQGDKIFLNILKNMGCKVRFGENRIEVKGGSLKNITVDMGDYPDIVQTLLATAAYADGESIIKNIGHLRYKESNRISSSVAELRKMGVIVKERKNEIHIFGGKPKGAEIETYSDHRMIMAFSTLALNADGKSIICGAEGVKKSFPEFFAKMKKLGAEIKMVK